MGFASALRPRVAAWWLLLCLAAGCSRTIAPKPDRYVGNWEDSQNHLRIDRNGLGEGRVIRGRHPRPFTWELGVDRITITFDGSNRPESFDAHIDAQGHLVVASARTEVKLARVDTLSAAAPDAPDEDEQIAPDASEFRTRRKFPDGERVRSDDENA